jgi:hypothetical protein
LYARKRERERERTERKKSLPPLFLCQLPPERPSALPPPPPPPPPPNASAGSGRAHTDVLYLVDAVSASSESLVE